MICRWLQFSIICAVQPQCFKQDQHFFFLKKGTETTPQTDFFCLSACSLSVLPLSILLYLSIVNLNVYVSAAMTVKVLGQVQTGSVIQYIPGDQLVADPSVHL